MCNCRSVSTVRLRRFSTVSELHLQVLAVETLSCRHQLKGTPKLSLRQLSFLSELVLFLTTTRVLSKAIFSRSQIHCFFLYPFPCSTLNMSPWRSSQQDPPPLREKRVHTDRGGPQNVSNFDNFPQETHSSVQDTFVLFFLKSLSQL